jgi:DNA-binding XRE family transcriptional regulator
MLVVEKARHIEVEIKGKGADSVIAALRREFPRLKVTDDDELVDVFETDWYKKIEARSTPGTTLHAYRYRDGFTQAQLAKLLGVSRQIVCDMEKDRRPISGKTARLLTDIFHTRMEVWFCAAP